ncbi:hypothetical protein KI387_014534 [Taxus chinensis]|uniref:F-box domain-containing protein n=1 Tax=Taxus chinensis TaxID=29808 RepID=A0AA38FI55_TAXCH|nr:hypothetical protein KI387_014534 [Taxus chinensis]
MDTFANVPQELERACLARVPYEFHGYIRAVCKRWKGIVKSVEFFQERKRIGRLEHRICVLEIYEYGQVTLYNPMHNSKKKLPSCIPHGSTQLPRCGWNCISVNQKLVLMGGYLDLKPTKTINVYDFCSSKWRNGAEMPTATADFACGASPEGMIYVAGGGVDHDESMDAALYDVNQDKWEVLPRMNRWPGLWCAGAFLDNKFFVIGFNNSELFDLRKRKWTILETHWNGGGVKTVTVSTSLYMFKGENVTEYDCKENVVRNVEPLCYRFRAWWVTLCGERIFIYGFDLVSRRTRLLLFDPKAIPQEMLSACEGNEGLQYLGLVVSVQL